MRNRGLLTAAALGLALLAGACGSDDGGGDGRAAKAADLQAGALKFARCMRDHGIDMPDPKTGANGNVMIQAGPAGKLKPGDPAFERAQKACEHFLPQRQNMTPAQEQEAQERMLKFARCMREHGIDIPDSAASGGPVRIGGPGSDVDPRDPAFQRAQKACMKDAPGPILAQKTP
jgi:hypothetical protein